MIKNQHKPVSATLDKKLKNYSRISQTVLLKPLKNPKHLLPLGVAFLSGAQAGEAAIVYSGTQNVSCALAGNSNRCFADINGGGNDFEIHKRAGGGVTYIRVNEVAGGGFNINGFIGNGGAYIYPTPLASGATIGAGGPWRFAAGSANTLSTAGGGYPGDQWTALPNGTTRFLGIRGTISGNTRYAWIRLTKNGLGNFTIVDWAYEDTGASLTAGQTLPVELVSFKAVLENKTTFLRWQTATETDNAGYDIERSTDGKKFQSIGWVEGKGTTKVAQEYLYQDASITEGKIYYYRLRQVDFSGKFEFSQVVSVTVGTKGVNVGDFYPNPATKGRTMLDFNADKAAIWTVTVFDASGKPVHNEQRPVSEGINTLAFNFTRIPQGMYFIKLENGAERIYRKLMVN